MSITGLRFKKEKFVIRGIAITFEDKKDFDITLKSAGDFIIAPLV